MYCGTMVNISPVLTFSQVMTSHDLICKIHICVTKLFDPDAACETSIYDVLAPQQFKTASPLPHHGQCPTAPSRSVPKNKTTMSTLHFAAGNGSASVSSLLFAVTSIFRRGMGSPCEKIEVEAMFCTWCELIVESVNAWKYYKKRVLSRG